ncbi:hypothetical protein EDB92DRAFT_1821258 [Lactarius akahatsu]|uniref:Uncharacterized protein n=1 Tax=Lactarius akahatsu TaxID=416441 RepID=A0AAD4L6M7_9AGAM|nr:hypothetical protein EDB92DRAFT_1821258 [Lactarius akahatsu]
MERHARELGSTTAQGISGVDGRTVSGRGTRGGLSRMGSGVTTTLLEGSDRASLLKTKRLRSSLTRGDITEHMSLAEGGSLWNVVTAQKPSEVNEPNELHADTVYALGFPGAPYLPVVLPPPPANLKFIKAHLVGNINYLTQEFPARIVLDIKRLSFSHAVPESLRQHPLTSFDKCNMLISLAAVAVYYAQRHTPAYMGNDYERGIQGTKRTYGHRSVVVRHVFVVTPSESSLDEYLGWVRSVVLVTTQGVGKNATRFPKRSDRYGDVSLTLSCIPMTPDRANLHTCSQPSYAIERGSQWPWPLELNLPGGVITEPGGGCSCRLKVCNFHWNSLNRQPPQSAVYSKGDQGVSRGGPPRSSPPPLGVALTCYRLLVITTAILWGSIKFTLAWQDKVPSFVATTVDVFALVFGIM